MVINWPIELEMQIYKIMDTRCALISTGYTSEDIFFDRIYRIIKILNYYFQFPEETENTQSPTASRMGALNSLNKIPNKAD